VVSWLQMKMKLETDAVDIVKEMIISGRKGAKLALIGDYFNYTNGFPIGAFMEKGQSMAGGQLWCQKYWKHLLHFIVKGEVDVRFLFSHRYRLSDIPSAYKTFAHHLDNCTKTIIHTEFGVQQENARRQRLGQPALTFGKIEMMSQPPVNMRQPIHLQHPFAQQSPQLLASLGASGEPYSKAVQGTTMSSMGTQVAGNRMSSTEETRMH